MKKFYCDCKFHIVEVDTTSLKGIPYISLCIYEYRSKNTGKLFKKPKLQGDVVLIGKEAEKFIKFIQKKKIK